MINYNGNIVSESQSQIDYNNRGFKYGDALFETVRIQDEAIVFGEDHYFRLMASMRMLRMEIPMHFTLEFFEQEILKTINANKGDENRVKITVFRDALGLYMPENNQISYVIECSSVEIMTKDDYVVEVYKDFTVNASFLSTVKSNNKLVNVLSSIYANENRLDNCVLMNGLKNVVEFNNGNIFIIKDHVVTTPPLSDGCVKGIARKKIIELIEKDPTLRIEEASFSPFAIQKADEVFLTNAMIGIQSVTMYKKKTFSTKIGTDLRAMFFNLN